MPTALMKTFAKEAGKKPKTVEKVWKKAEAMVKDKYDIDEESSRFYPLVVGVLKNLLNIRQKEMIKEDGEGGDVSVDVAPADGGMDTTSMGDYQYAPKLGMAIVFPPIPKFQVAKKKTRSKKKNRDVSKSVKKMKSTVKKKNLKEDFDYIFSSILLEYMDTVEVDELIDVTFDAIERYLGIEESIFDGIGVK